MTQLPAVEADPTAVDLRLLDAQLHMAADPRLRQQEIARRQALRLVTLLSVAACTLSMYDLALVMRLGSA